MLGVPAKLPFDFHEDSVHSDISEHSIDVSARIDYITEVLSKLRQAAISNIQFAQARKRNDMIFGRAISRR